MGGHESKNNGGYAATGFPFQNQFSSVYVGLVELS